MKKTNGENASSRSSRHNREQVFCTCTKKCPIFGGDCTNYMMCKPERLAEVEDDFKNFRTSGCAYNK